MIDIPKLKKTALWFVPLLLFVAWLSAWSTIDGVVPMIHDLAQQQASLRIGPLLLLQPVATVWCFSILALVFLRIWRFEKAAIWIEKRIFIPVLLLGLILIPVLIVGGSLLQNYYLPRLGYHYCNKLNDNPSVWFNDWVKDPELCVYEKTHEWVREQAAQKNSGAGFRP